LSLEIEKISFYIISLERLKMSGVWISCSVKVKEDSEMPYLVSAMVNRVPNDHWPHVPFDHGTECWGYLRKFQIENAPTC